MHIKAQVQAISLVLITGIVISLAGAAYIWGKPLIEKRSTITDIATAEAFMIQLDQQIIDAARNRGEKSINIPSLPGASLSINESENSIVMNFITTQPMLAMGEESVPVPIDSQNIEAVGTYGESPRTITLQAKVHESQYLMTLKLVYRTLYTSGTPKRGYAITLNSGGVSGKEKISVSYDSVETELVTGADGDAELVKTIIRADIS